MDSMDLNHKNRDQLVFELMDLDRQIYSDDPYHELSDRERSLLKERFYQIMEEYSDQLPRLILSRCPHCGELLKRVFDPFGLEGPWWQVSGILEIEEPQHCRHFKVLLGAVSLHGREPKEVVEEVHPGPDVPFIVPKLLDLPGMVAVMTKITLATGDTAYPIAYFSPEDIPPVMLHQPWCRKDYWFTTEEGISGWSVANDIFDFDIRKYVEQGQLKWIDLEEKDFPFHPSGNEECSYLNLPGDKENQIIVEGKRYLVGLPTGEPINPYED